ncbi:hypothetical protein [Streptomyces sp. NPDC000878]
MPGRPDPVMALIARPVTGLGETTTTTTGTVPAVGTAYVGSEGNINLNGTWTSVTRTSTDEALAVVYGGTRVVIRP